MQQRVKKIIQKLATKYNLSEREAEHAVKVYYEKIREVLGEGKYPEEHTFKIMLIPFFGRFIPNTNKIKKRYAGEQERRFREHFEPRPECDSLQGIHSWGENN